MPPGGKLPHLSKLYFIANIFTFCIYKEFNRQLELILYKFRVSSISYIVVSYTVFICLSIYMYLYACLFVNPVTIVKFQSNWIHCRRRYHCRCRARHLFNSRRYWMLLQQEVGLWQYYSIWIMAQKYSVLWVLCILCTVVQIANRSSASTDILKRIVGC
jgi:hypothetical protein